MAGGVTLQIRQVGSYPLVGSAGLGDLILMQPGGLGNPYATVDAATLVATALASQGPPPLGLGGPPPSDASGGQGFSGDWVLANEGSLLWNAYIAAGGTSNLAGGVSGRLNFDVTGGFSLGVATPLPAGQPIPAQAWTDILVLNGAGAMSLSRGTLTVARDPGAALEVATMGWVGRNTATSFNGRQGAITLNGCDVYSALCLNEQIATEPWVMAAIRSSTEMLLANHPFVFGWNGRTGAVYLTLADISCVFFQPGQQPITQTPPLDSNDYSIPNTQWVVEYIANEFAGSGTTIATQQWVLANTVNSFNGRRGIVTLGLADITAAGGAPILSPQFSGIPQAPTAAPGQATGQIATTLFVQLAVQSAVTGVISFNDRTGAITLEATDINDAGGALLASPAFSGTPTTPTAATGTATTQVASCAFVLNEVQAIGAGVTTFNTRSGNVVLELADIEGAGGAPVASPAFSGTPTCPTPSNPVTATTAIANTAWVVQYNALSTVASFNGRIGAVTLSAADISGAGGLANPNIALTGVPTAPTALPGTSTTQLATTAFVQAAISNLGGNYVPLAGNVSISGPLTMLGAGSTLTLAGNATANMQAVPLQQLNAALGAYLPLSGGAVTGPTTVTSTNANVLLGVLTQNAPPGTQTYPVAVGGEASLAVGSNGNTCYGLYGVAQLYAAAGSSTGCEITSRNFAGPPYLGLPPANEFGTTAIVPNGLQVTAGGSYNSSVGVMISSEGGSAMQFNTAAYIRDFAQYGIYLDTGPTAAATNITAVNNGNNFNLVLATSGAMQPANVVLDVIDAQGTPHFSVTQNGSISTTGTLSGTTANFSGALTAPTVNISGASAYSLTTSGGNPTITWAAGWWDDFILGTGLRRMIGNAGSILLTLSGAGVATVTGNIITGGWMLPSGNNAAWCGAAGQAWFGVAAYQFAQQSDPRLKKDLATAPSGALAHVLALPVHNYRYLEQAETDPLHWGWLSTEVHAEMGNNFAGWMQGEDANKTESLSVYDMVAVLWAAVQELAAKLGAA